MGEFAIRGRHAAQCGPSIPCTIGRSKVSYRSRRGARACVCLLDALLLLCSVGAVLGSRKDQKNERHCPRQMVQHVRSKVFFCEPTWAPACRGYLTLATLVWLSWTAQLACCNSAHVQVRAWLSNDGSGGLKMKMGFNRGLYPMSLVPDNQRGVWGGRHGRPAFLSQAKGLSVKAWPMWVHAMSPGCSVYWSVSTVKFL